MSDCSYPVSIYLVALDCYECIKHNFTNVFRPGIFVQTEWAEPDRTGFFSVFGSIMVLKINSVFGSVFDFQKKKKLKTENNQKYPKITENPNRKTQK